MWIEWLEVFLFILCIYFAYKGCYQDYITSNPKILREKKCIRPKNKIDNDSTLPSTTTVTDSIQTPPSYNSIVNCTQIGH